MPTYSEVLAQAGARLAAAGIDTPQLDARYLLEAASGLSHAGLRLAGPDAMPSEQVAQYELLIDRRTRREPVGRILGRREFWSLSFALSPDTLEPRPDSETLIEAALAHITNRQAPLRLLDLGTGTGCLLAALLYELPKAQGVGVDLSAGAVATATANLSALGLAARAQVVQGNWGEGLSGPFDLVISNPPYIAQAEKPDLAAEVLGFDPPLALFAQEQGLAAYRAILADLPRLLTPKGIAVLELGQGQAGSVRALALAQGLSVLELRRDLGGIERALILARAA